ncbi:hypothetical protein C0Q70_20684 [Pomacea canaliculata]|uniref:Uncharacterized protein n=1 Tax=Pomacea canaliculata TaxID=400727 RepID=A0A2T7NG98_POMCA|nr:hypothetical protein C0Q70_20684 [Pomacea canaliculata]
MAKQLSNRTDPELKDAGYSGAPSLVSRQSVVLRVTWTVVLALVTLFYPHVVGNSEERELVNRPNFRSVCCGLLLQALGQPQSAECVPTPARWTADKFPSVIGVSLRDEAADTKRRNSYRGLH